MLNFSFFYVSFLCSKVVIFVIGGEIVQILLLLRLFLSRTPLTHPLLLQDTRDSVHSANVNSITAASLQVALILTPCLYLQIAPVISFGRRNEKPLLERPSVLLKLLLQCHMLRPTTKMAVSQAVMKIWLFLRQANASEGPLRCPKLRLPKV